MASVRKKILISVKQDKLIVRKKFPFSNYLDLFGISKARSFESSLYEHVTHSIKAPLVHTEKKGAPLELIPPLVRKLQIPPDVQHGVDNRINIRNFYDDEV